MRLTNDFVAVMARGNVEIQGVPYRVFHWTPDFNEEEDSPLMPVWISLPSLPSNYLTLSMLQSIGGGLGWFLKLDNATECVMRLEAARIYVEMDVSKPLHHHF